MAGGFVGLADGGAYLRGKRGGPRPDDRDGAHGAFLLGALAQDEPQIAAGMGVAVALVLAFRERLHGLVRDTLSEEEVHDGLLFAAAALIILPLVPDKGFGPQAHSTRSRSGGSS